MGIHFYSTERDRPAQAKRTEHLLGDNDLPTILPGDFNSQPGDSVVTYLSEFLSGAEKGEYTSRFPRSMDV